MKRQGFFLLEFVLYLAIFSCIILLLMQAAVYFTLFSRDHCLNVRHTLQLLTAIDYIRHEINKASSQKKYWIKTEKNSFTWHSKTMNKDIQIAYEDKKLVKKVGIFNKNQNSWQSKVTTILATECHGVSFAFLWDNEKTQLESIELTAKVAGHCYQQSMNIYHGISYAKA